MASGSTDSPITSFAPTGAQPAPKNVQSYSEDWLIYHDDMGYPYVDATFSTAASTILPNSWSEIRLNRRLGKRQRVGWGAAVIDAPFGDCAQPSPVGLSASSS